MNVYKYLKNINSADLYVNAVLVLLLIFFAVCITSACQKMDHSWETIRSKKSGSVLIAYVGAADILYKDEAGVLHGEGVESFNRFLNSAEGTYDVKIIPELQNFDDAQEVVKKIKISNGGVFGWNIGDLPDSDIETVFLPDEISDQKSKPIGVALKASSDWLPLLSNYISQNMRSIELNPSLPGINGMPHKSSF